MYTYLRINIYTMYLYLMNKGSLHNSSSSSCWWQQEQEQQQLLYFDFLLASVNMRLILLHLYIISSVVMYCIYKFACRLISNMDVQSARHRLIDIRFDSIFNQLDVSSSVFNVLRSHLLLLFILKSMRVS